ncbi:MAG: rhomboid family protein [Candidatus Hydrogenedentes bacterium]|nr:rhomboid family protein [Candidatus Hydrogenedentota bacterium]
MASLTHTKCFNHDQREAVARCPSCRRHFCRECVTEHEHRLLCAGCLKAALAEPAERPARIVPFRAFFQFVAALTVLWLVFFAAGQTLLLLPSSFHDAFNGALGNAAPAARDGVEDAP